LPWAAAPFPYPAGHAELAGTSHAEADVLMIPKGSPHPAEAFAFMQYTSTQPVLEKLCLAQQKFTPLSSVSEEFWLSHPNPYIRLFRELGTSKNAVAIPQIGIWNEYKRELDNAVDLIQGLKESPATALANVQTKMQVALDRERRILVRRAAE
jgi:multiple sugar transport system substrate-binding protein